jgi:hypothetical protein
VAVGSESTHAPSDPLFSSDAIHRVGEADRPRTQPHDFIPRQQQPALQMLAEAWAEMLPPFPIPWPEIDDPAVSNRMVFCPSAPERYRVVP